MFNTVSIPLPSPYPALTRCLHKDIGRIAQCLDPHMLGVFVKTVLRVVSYLDVTREVTKRATRLTRLRLARLRLARLTR